MSKSEAKDLQLTKALSVLNKIGRTLTAVENPKDILRQIATDAKDVLNADIVDLYEYNQGRNEFPMPPVLVGERKDKFVPKYKIFEDDVVYKVVRAGKPKYFPNAQKAKTLTGKFNIDRSDAPAKRFVVREGVLSSVSLPLKAGTETVGVMFVNFRTHQEFEDEQRNLIESFSNLAAIAIHNARLLSSRGMQLTALKDIIDVIGTKEEPLSEILVQTVKMFSANNGSISRLTEDGKYLQHKVRWLDGRLDDDVREDPYKHPISKGITGHVVKTAQPFRTGDVSQVKFYDPWNSTTKSELAIPLKNIFGGIIGVLNLESNFVDFFTKEDEKLGESFANAASAAIQQSDLVEDLQSLHYLTESHTLKELLDRILESITRFMGENTVASVNLYDSENDFFYAFSGIGPDQELVDKYLLIPPRPNGTGRYVLNTKSALFYDNVNEIPIGFPKVRPESSFFGIASFVCLPLNYKEEIVGTLFIQKIKEHVKFNDDIKRVLEAYANQAALAIHNAQRLIDVQPLKAILGATVTENRQTILDTIVEKTLDIIAADYASIWMPEQETGDLVSQASFIKPEERNAFISGFQRIKSDQASINMTVYKDKKPLIIGDVRVAEKEGRYHRVYKNAMSEIAVPLIFGGEILGTLNAESKYLGAYSEFDKTTLRIFADVAAVAIVNSRSYEQRVEDIAALEEINSAIGRKPLAEIYKLIAQKAKELTEAAYSTLWLVDKKTQSLKVGAVFGREASEDTLALNDKSINGHVALTKQSYICGDTAHDSYYHQWYPDIRSNLTVPIVFDEKLIGTLHVESTQKNAYNENQEKLLESLAYQAAIAIENARLFDQNDKLINRKIKHLNAVIDMGKDLTASVDLSETQVLNLIYDKLHPLMETGNMYIALYDHATDMVRFPLMFVDGKKTEVPARKAGSGRTEYIIETKEPLFVATREESVAWYEKEGHKDYIDEPFASWIGVPMNSGDKVIGVIATYHKTADYVYDQDDLDVLQAIANQSAIALEVTHRVAELKALQGLTNDLSSGLL
jgi:GAF domain-containing protein